jgi:hypothetical protein
MNVVDLFTDLEHEAFFAISTISKQIIMQRCCNSKPHLIFKMYLTTISVTEFI